MGGNRAVLKMIMNYLPMSIQEIIEDMEDLDTVSKALPTWMIIVNLLHLNHSKKKEWRPSTEASAKSLFATKCKINIVSVIS